MRRMIVVLAAALVGACTATVDKQSVRATQTAPESTQVDVVRIPYDPSLPYYVVTVEPFGFAAPIVALATAHPAKFPDAVERATGRRPALPDRLASLFERPERVEVLPNDLKAVQGFIRSRNLKGAA